MPKKDLLNLFPPSRNVPLCRKTSVKKFRSIWSRIRGCYRSWKNELQTSLSFCSWCVEFILVMTTVEMCKCVKKNMYAEISANLNKIDITIGSLR